VKKDARWRQVVDDWDTHEISIIVKWGSCCEAKSFLNCMYWGFFFLQLDACCINLEVCLNNTTGAMIEIDFPYTFYAMGTFGFELLKVRYFGEILFFSKCHCNFYTQNALG
jgi:hypothetical protein